MADPSETLEELYDLLAQATHDGERARLHDGIAIKLSGDGRFEEAVAESLRAVALFELLAGHDAAYYPNLSVSLTNHGAYLAFVGRQREGVVTYLRALEVLSQLDWSVPAQLAQVNQNAFQLGLILVQLRNPRFAARFLGIALATRLELVEQDFDARELANQRLVLCLSLDRVDNPAPPLPDTLDEGRLLAAAKPSPRAAAHLGQLARAAADNGELALAADLARRAVAYCDLFAESARDQSLTSLRAQNARTLAEISARRQSFLLGSTPREADSRLWSISGEQLSGLVRELGQLGFPTSDVYTLGRRLGEAGFYPARDCAYRCLPRPPQVFITYTWSENYVDLQVNVRNALNYLGGLIRNARPELDIEVVDRLVNERLGVWIDFVFIDQSSRRLVEEVREVLPRALESADVHFVLSEKAMLRSWCCYEVALFNRPDPAESARQERLRTFMGRSRALDYQTFARTHASQAADKQTIEQAIVDSYPGGMSAFDFLMIQASMLSDPFVSSGFAQTQDAIDVVGRSVDGWLSL